jgi:hypothetical protein
VNAPRAAAPLPFVHLFFELKREQWLSSLSHATSFAMPGGCVHGFVGWLRGKITFRRRDKFRQASGNARGDH